MDNLYLLKADGPKIFYLFFLYYIKYTGVDEALGVVPQACQGVRATYKDDKQAINQSCLDVAAARDATLAACDGFWNYCKTPCDQTPPVSGKIKVGGDEAWANLCAAKQALEACRAQRAADLEAFQQAVNAVCCPFWPCKISCPSIVGDWIITFDWHCDGSSDLAPFIFNADGTSSYGTNWSQDSCDMQFWFPSGTTYTGNVTSDGTHLSGTMVDYLGVPGCWTADRIDSGTDVPADVPSNNDEPLDIAGNPK